VKMRIDAARVSVRISQRYKHYIGAKKSRGLLKKDLKHAESILRYEISLCLIAWLMELSETYSIP
jgi:hypothetical protein